MQFGRRRWVCPGGQRPPASAFTDQARGVTEEPVLLELDPGLAFGTGTHATTAMCLEWLESGAARWLDGADLIDYGCGSGILAIAAVRLGARHALGMDIDPQALLATRENAARNGVADRVTTTDERTCGGAIVDVLVANILAGPLVELAPLLAGRVRSGGHLAVSGLLLEQVAAVVAAYRPWFDLELATAREDWALLAGRRRP